LNTAFRYPLPAFHLTSGFGLRRNPVTGHLVFHEGLDLAAPEGTEVYACREGTVQEIGYNAIYGNYVLLQHEGGWTSLYGHLSAVLTVLHKNLQSGSLLGRVGSTGQSTGPHLHFELRQNGKPLNPANVLPTRGIER
jgi:murein DD-endopeptidase MepM/ murein hydrolase activator NlpD